MTKPNLGVIRCTALLSLLLALPCTAKQLTVSDIDAIQTGAMRGEFSSRASWNALAFYLQGVIEGVAAYHQGLSANTQSRLFCPPDNKGYSIDEMLSLLKRAPAKDKSRSASMVLMEMYAREYPCT